MVQKPFYPEAGGVCHAVVVHPPGGIAGGDDLRLNVESDRGSAALLTTPGAGKWYRSAGALARQRLVFEGKGSIEWLPRESIVFDGALADLGSEVALKGDACYIGWEVICLGRSGSGERFRRGRVGVHTRLSRDGRLLWQERGLFDAASPLLQSPAGLGGRSVFGTLIAAAADIPTQLVAACREKAGALAITLLPGRALLGRYLGDSSEEAMEAFTRAWEVIRPALLDRPAQRPRIWST